jgi:light-regulated signal transduction histidine kinase (bacteriophytochrome)/ActR/RegA family two-component response regulator
MVTHVDLTNCDREPIHIPGGIQPHGAMLVCEPATFRVLYASENIGRVTGYAGDDVIGAELSSILGERVAHDVRNAAAKAGGSEIAGVVLGVKLAGVETPVDLVVHNHRGRAFVEIEPSTDGGKSAHDALDITQTLIRRIGLESDVGAIATAGAKLVRAMLGYDRVMVYQFLHNGAGRVIAEAKRPGPRSFMGQHFPASDIPYQARRLYLANTIRMIGDVSYAPIPLRPPLAAGDEPVDMSFAQLRSVSPIHCQYLWNMGVFASLSISIVVDGELWGLISCHHDSPKVVPMPLRIGAELFGQYFSLQISVAERRAQILASSVARDRLDKIVATLRLNGALADDLSEHLADFGALIENDGVALLTEGVWRASGATPPRDVVGRLLETIADDAKGGIWSTQEVGALVGTAPFGGAVAGMLAIPISSKPRDYLMFFRSEEAHNIEWAGEPAKTVVSTPGGDRLTPRGSFETWREEVKGRSKPWTAPELAVAEAIRTYLRDIVLRHGEATAEERARNEQRRRILNDELNHRVKNIITLVKSIALQTGVHASSVADYSASLEGRLRALAFAHDQSLGGASTGDLSTLVEAEASLHRYGAAPDRVTARGPRVRLDDQAFGVLALVIHEMMTNAAKYGALSTPEGRLKLEWDFTADGDCELLWSESDGPEVAPPSRDGFGTKLIHSTMAYDLRGSVSVDFAPGGVRARFQIPAAHVASDARPPSAAERPWEPNASLSELSILVVEDQSLIAMDMEETLTRLGASRIRLSPSVGDALTLLNGFRPDVAVLDFNLGHGTSEPIAEVLSKGNIPFVFATGYGDNVMIPRKFGHVPVVRKPVNSALLAAKISAAIDGVRPTDDFEPPASA